MRYWDASAVVPLLVVEPGTDLARAWLADDAVIVTWALTAVEVTGAIERRARQGMLPPATRRALLRTLEDLTEQWDEVVELWPVREFAMSAMARHALRAADALQLGAANILAEGRPQSLEFVCLDRQLADIADREGFRVLTWPD